MIIIVAMYVSHKLDLLDLISCLCDDKSKDCILVFSSTLTDALKLMLYLQCFVPAASHDTTVVWGFYPVDCFDRTVML